MDKAERLLQAHLQFELERLSGDAMKGDLDELLQTLWQWAEQTRLEQVMDADDVVDTTIRWVEDWYLPDTLTLLIGAVVKRLIQLPVNTETRLGDLIDDQLFEAGVDLIVELERLREILITQATESPIYAMLISNVLYSGIRDYLTGENAVTNKVPGVGSLLSKGASALNKRMPGLEGAIEDRLRKYISANTEKSIRRSRSFLLEALNEEQIRKLAEQIWDRSKHTQLHVADLLEDEEIDRLISFGLAIWQDLRQTSYIQELIREAIFGFYDAYGSENVALLLQHIGISREHLEAEVHALAPGLLANAQENGLLRALLEPRLRAFYASSEARSLLLD